MSDISFIAEDRVIYAHLLVLYTRCPKLYEIALASKTRQIEICGITYKLLFELLSYIYCGQIPCLNHLHEIVDIVIWCKRFELSSLFDRVEFMLYKMINEKNLAILLLTAEKYNMRQLEMACIIYLINSSSNITSQFPFHYLSFKSLYTIGLLIFPKNNKI